MTRSGPIPQISVIIPVYNDLTGLRSTLSSLQDQTIPDTAYEIIVANDGGNSDIEKLCKRYGVRIKNIIPNKGSYFARNEAIKLAMGSKLAFVDADILVSSDWLENGIKALTKFDYIAGPVEILEKDDFSVAEWYEFFTAFNIQDYLERHHFGVTGNLFVKKRVFDEVGLFDGQIRSGGDFEFGDRVFNSGKFSQAFDKNVAVKHPARGYKNYLKKIRRISEGRIILTQKYPDRFPSIKPRLYKLIGLILLPPINLKNLPFSIKLYLYSWYMNILRGLFTIKYLIKHKFLS